MGIDRHVCRVVFTEPPTLARLINMERYQRFEVLWLRAKSTAMRKPPVVFHVDDEGRQLAIAQVVLRCQLHLFPFCSQRLRLRQSPMLFGNHTQLCYPAVHSIFSPILVREHSLSAGSPLIAPCVLNDEYGLVVSEDDEYFSSLVRCLHLF